MADIKVRDLTDTSSVALDNQIMVLTNDAQNQVQNITVENLLSNVLSSDNGNVLEQGTDGKLYVETPENITGNLADLDTVNKTSLVNSINEVVSNLSTEATTRANADNNLQSQIDAITAASDVTDIVGTYAQLQAYDTTGLPDNSIIKVLQDESRQDETTYYRWVITGSVGAWVLIGEEGPYYTKSQADSLFATQQTTGNLASLDTSDKTSLVNAINELSSVLDPTQTADYINNSKAVESGAISSNSIILSNVIKYAHSTFDLSKFTVVGSPNITDDGIANGFNPTNALTQNISIASGSNVIINIDVTNGEWTSGQYQMPLQLCASDNTPILTISRYDTKLRIGSSESPANTLITNSSAKITLDTDLATYIKCYVNSALVIDTTFTNSVNVAKVSIGNHITPEGWKSWQGSIDLKQFSITVDGVEVFSGNKTGIDTIKPDDYTVVGTPTISADGVASGFVSQTNYITGSFAPVSAKNKIELWGAITNNSADTDGSVICATNGNLRIIKTSANVIGIRGLAGGLTLNSPNLQLQDGDFVIAHAIVTTTDATLQTWVNGVKQTDVTVSGDFSAVATAYDSLYIGGQYNNGNYSPASRIDMNYGKVLIDGNLVYQPCLKIPYTKGSEQYGGKYVNAQYLPRVKDAYEQGLANDYFTLDEVNGTYTLPMGNLYGMIEKLNQLAKDEIGLPKATLSNTLNDNEIWLEGAEVSKLTYSKLYAIYGDDYGTPTDSANFVLPDFRDRVMQGIGSGGTFGYISAGLPNITGKVGAVAMGDGDLNGCFGNYTNADGEINNTNANKDYCADFNASWSNSIYGNSTTVQPPAIKVRFKTRFQ